MNELAFCAKTECTQELCIKEPLANVTAELTHKNMKNCNLSS